MFQQESPVPTLPAFQLMRKLSLLINDIHLLCCYLLSVLDFFFKSGFYQIFPEDIKIYYLEDESLKKWPRAVVS